MVCLVASIGVGRPTPRFQSLPGRGRDTLSATFGDAASEFDKKGLTDKHGKCPIERKCISHAGCVTFGNT